MEVIVMKKKIFVICVLALLITSSTACGLMQRNTAEVKVIPKDKPKVTDSATTNNTTKPDESKNTQNTDLDDKKQSIETGTEEYIKSIIGSRAGEVLSIIKAKDMDKLSQVVHPTKGVRFSPYGHIIKETDLVFTPDQIKTLAADQKVYNWGSYDGSGDPIQLTYTDYHNKFVYDEDFLNAKEIGYNKILGMGNTLVNSSQVYPKAIVVEYYFPGFDPQYEGMDWRSLRLAFEKSGDTWYLVGIIHDQWTI
jgi:hypothetical protein